MPTYSGIKKIEWLPLEALTKLQRLYLMTGLRTKLPEAATEIPITGKAVMTETKETGENPSRATELSFATTDETAIPEAAVWIVTDANDTRWAICPRPPHTGTVNTQRTTSDPKSDPVVTTVKIKIPCAPVAMR